MNKFFEIMMRDIQGDGLTGRREIIVYAIVVPVALVALCLLADFINSLY